MRKTGKKIGMLVRISILFSFYILTDEPTGGSWSLRCCVIRYRTARHVVEIHESREREIVSCVYGVIHNIIFVIPIKSHPGIRNTGDWESDLFWVQPLEEYAADDEAVLVVLHAFDLLPASNGSVHALPQNLQFEAVTL